MQVAVVYVDGLNFRRKVINPGIFAYLKLKIKEIGKHYPELEVKEINYDRDHIHILISIPPKMSVWNAVRIIKANTARSIRQKFPILRKVYWGSERMWSDGYFVSTIGINESIIRRYIEEQGKEDAGQAKLELS